MAKHYLDPVILELKDEADIQVMWRPYCLMEPGSPYDGVPILQYLQERFGDAAARAAREGTGHLHEVAKSLVSIYHA